MSAVNESIIRNYIKAYNAMDVDGMCRDLHPDIIFENIAGEEVTMSLGGIRAFREQAETAKRYFRQREQQIDTITHEGDTATVTISYNAILAIDLPNGLKAGDTMTMKGKSVFEFDSGKVIKLQDIS